jgi:hypothetical protein
MELIVTFAFLTYGLCFGFANKLPNLYSDGFKDTGVAESVMDNLLSCTYCLGFHCGWLSAVLMWCFFGFPSLGWHTAAFGLVICGFASSAWCYFIDTAVRWLEGNS